MSCHFKEISIGQWLPLLTLWHNTLCWCCQPVLALWKVATRLQRCAEALSSAGSASCFALPCCVSQRNSWCQMLSQNPMCVRSLAPCASFFQVVLTLVVYQSASVATKVGWYHTHVKLFFFGLAPPLKVHALAIFCLFSSKFEGRLYKVTCPLYSVFKVLA